MQAEIRALDPEIMPMVEQWREYKSTGSLFKPEFVAQFLEWFYLKFMGHNLVKENGIFAIQSGNMHHRD